MVVAEATAGMGLGSMRACVNELANVHIHTVRCMQHPHTTEAVDALQLLLVAHLLLRQRGIDLPVPQAVWEEVLLILRSCFDICVYCVETEQHRETHTCGERGEGVSSRQLRCCQQRVFQP